MSYFEDLRDDLEAQGLSPTRSPITTYIGLVSLLYCTVHIRPLQPSEHETLPTTAKTELGQRILNLTGPSRVFMQGGYRCCPDAETRLIQNLTMGKIDDTSRNPIIMTRQNEPVAILKGIGQGTCYALRSVPEIDLVEGTFAIPGRQPNLLSLPETDGAYRYELPDGSFFRGRRFSAFAIPVSERASLLSSQDSAVLEQSHEDLVKQTEMLFQTALPLN